MFSDAFAAFLSTWANPELFPVLCLLLFWQINMDSFSDKAHGAAARDQMGQRWQKDDKGSRRSDSLFSLQTLGEDAYET